MAEACILADPNHCSNTGDPCAEGLVCDPCTPSNLAANGCVAANDVLDQQPDLGGCQALSGGVSTDDSMGTESTAATTIEPTITTTIDPDTTVTSGETEASTTTGEPQPCTSDEECTEGNAVFCSPVLQECVTCTGMPDPEVACEGRDPTLPACADGVCVECKAGVTSQCTGEMPVCDEGTNTCMPCSEHEQCGMAACNLFTGACVEGPVVTVGPAGQDHTTISDAVDSILAGGGGTIIVYQDSYDEAVTIDGGAIVAFLANGSDRPTWQRTGGVAAPQLRSTGGATVLMEGFDMRNNPAIVSPAVRADGGALWVDRTIFAQNDGPALSAENTTSFRLRNSFVAGAVDIEAVSITNSTVIVEYSTVGAGTGDATAIVCDAGSSVTVRDSIIVSRGIGPEIACDPLTADHTASNTEITNGMSNVGVGATVTAWFTSYNTGDFHLTPGGGQPVFAGVAEWNDGDPRVDIDDLPRSLSDGMDEHAGADYP